MDRREILSYVPTVIEASSRGEKSFDIFSRMLRERIIFLGEEIDDEMANSIVAQLLVLDAENPEKDLTSGTKTAILLWSWGIRGRVRGARGII